MKFKILFLPFCRSNISNVMGCGFNFERFIAQKKIFWFTLPQNDLIFLLSHLYLIMYISMKKIIIIFKIIMIYISIERIFFCFSACSFYHERFIAQKKTLLIHNSLENFYPVSKMKSFITIDIFPEGNNFLILLQFEWFF